MTKNKFNSILRAFVKNKLSPTNCYNKNCGKCDKCFVTKIYESFRTVLNQNCIQIGSYPRFTATKPLHDLDILYILDHWNEQSHNPYSLLTDLLNKIRSDYTNPTHYTIEATLQTHSVTVCFKNGIDEAFSVDIVPAYIFAKNNFKQDTYKVPEITVKKHGKSRTDFYKLLSEEKREMEWIHTDPRGYIKVAENINTLNSDFRKAVKFVKAWKESCKVQYEDFKLKSFHIEQVLTKYFGKDNKLEIFDSIFNFFCDIPEILSQSQITNRASGEENIDEYVNSLTGEQKLKIIEARDSFLIKLEEFSEDDSVDSLLKGDFYKRFSQEERFLFDNKIPTLTEATICINGWIQKDGKDFRRLSQSGLIDNGQRIRFETYMGINPDLYKWKVKNDNGCECPRGEITNYQTKNNPENTKYKGNHFVECYAIVNNICVAKARQNVKLE